MISSSVNVGKYRVEEKITPLGIACVVCRLIISFLNPQPRVDVAASVYLLASADSQDGAFPAPMHCTDMSFPTFFNIFSHPMLSTVSLLMGVGRW